jgi:hypothetical protein
VGERQRRFAESHSAHGAARRPPPTGTGTSPAGDRRTSLLGMFCRATQHTPLILTTIPAPAVMPPPSFWSSYSPAHEQSREQVCFCLRSPDAIPSVVLSLSLSIYIYIYINMTQASTHGGHIAKPTKYHCREAGVQPDQERGVRGRGNWLGVPFPVRSTGRRRRQPANRIKHV